MSSENDAQEILREVERRKKRAEDLGIEKVILCLFFGDRFLSFSSYKIEGASSIFDFKKSNDVNNERCKYTLNNRKYLVSYLRHQSKLEISVDGKKVLTMQMAVHYTPINDPYSPISEIQEWRCSEIESFIEGEWVQDLKNLIKQIEADEKEEKRKKEEDPERIKKLKEEFGIE